MGIIPESVVRQLVSTTSTERPTKTVTGTAVEHEGSVYVRLDGSDQLTPIASSTAGMHDGDRVSVQVVDHSARVVGNVSDPAASGGDLDSAKEELGTKITELENVVADTVTTEELEAERARIDSLVAEDATIKGRLDATEASIGELEADGVQVTGKLEAVDAEIDRLESSKADISVLESEYATIKNLEATNADVRSLEADYGSFKDLTTDNFSAVNGSVANLEANKLDATEADIRYADIDFSNIGEAAVEELFAKSGIIEDMVVSEGHVTGRLVGVTIVGDLIEGGTVKADKLVVRGEDGLYYKLNVSAETIAAEQTEYNSLNGDVITAHTITAEKVNVDDLVAFQATIGGFNIGANDLHSGTKATMGSSVPGVYLGSDGQIAVGDGTSYLRFSKDAEGKWALEISSDSILTSSGESVATIAELAGETARDAMDAAESAMTAAGDAQDAADAAQSSLDSYKGTVSSTYATKTEVSQTAQGITQTVSETYVSKTDAESSYQPKGDYATSTELDAAISEEVADRNSAISQSASEITSTVSQTYATKQALSTVEGKADSAREAADGAQDDLDAYKGTVSSTYATKTEVTQTADGIRQEVSEEYQSKDGMSSYATKSYVDQQDTSISSTVQSVKTTADSALSKASTVEQTAAGLEVTLTETTSTANSALSKANSAATAASNAQSTANTANSTANAAKTAAASAAKTATNYLKFDNSGLCVGDHAGTLGYNTLVRASGVDIRNGDAVLASFEEDAIDLGINASNTSINMCGGALSIRRDGRDAAIKNAYADGDTYANLSVSSGLSCLDLIARLSGFGEPAISFGTTFLDLTDVMYIKTSGMSEYDLKAFTIDELYEAVHNQAYVVTSFASGFEAYATTAAHTPTVRRAGRVCTLSGACTPTRDVTGSSTQVTMFTLPAELRPAQNVNVLCQGSSRSRYLLTVNSSGSVQMSRYCTGSAYQTCEPGNWLTLNATWVLA